ncbi:hypothetical protein FACS189472_02160 [Alphaproteobacteria bacterium]|nr:hypothetical protein FACS189472_02160 [Alphaproteobacteria bacterium]
MRKVTGSGSIVASQDEFHYRCWVMKKDQNKGIPHLVRVLFGPSADELFPRLDASFVSTKTPLDLEVRFATLTQISDNLYDVYDFVCHSPHNYSPYKYQIKLLKDRIDGILLKEKFSYSSPIDIVQNEATLDVKSYSSTSSSSDAPTSDVTSGAKNKITVADVRYCADFDSRAPATTIQQELERRCMIIDEYTPIPEQLLVLLPKLNDKLNIPGYTVSVDDADLILLDGVCELRTLCLRIGNMLGVLCGFINGRHKKKIRMLQKKITGRCGAKRHNRRRGKR